MIEYYVILLFLSIMYTFAENSTIQKETEEKIMYIYNYTLDVINNSQIVVTNTNITYIRGLTFNRSDLVNIVDVDFSGNKIKVLYDRLLVGLPNLEYVNFAYNRISRISQNTFTRCPLLKQLILSANELTKLNEPMFAGLTSLVMLKLNHNKLRTLPARLFDPLIRLDYLSLSNNRIENLDRAFTALAALRNLYLNHNRLNGITSRTLIGLTGNMRMFTAGNNQLRVVYKHAFREMAGLRLLHLNDNRLQRLRRVTFGELTNLSHADLSGNRLRCDCSLAWLVLRKRKPAKAMLMYKVRLVNGSRDNRDLKCADGVTPVKSSPGLMDCRPC